MARFSLTKLEATSENLASRRYAVLYNSFSFLLISYGEITFALHTLLLFLCCRYGPNAEYTAVAPNKLDEDRFQRLMHFLYAIITIGEAAGGAGGCRTHGRGHA